MRSIVAVLAILFTASAAQAQLGLTPGIGAGIQPLFVAQDADVLTATNRVDVYFPLQISERFRVEPAIGYVSESEEIGDATESSSVWGLGTGLFYTSPLTTRTLWYVGPRVGLAFVGTDDEDAAGNESTTSRTDVRLGLGVGGEHFFTERFSLGGEVQLNRVWIGEVDEDPEDPTAPDESGSVTATRALLFIRWYFGDMQF